MRRRRTRAAAIANSGEVVILFSWDGVSDLVADIDYVVYGDLGDAVDKTGITVGASTYFPDTPTAAQMPAAAPSSGSSSNRCDTAEPAETKSGGNGVTGHDETSEPSAGAFTSSSTRSPGSAPPAGVCP